MVYSLHVVFWWCALSVIALFFPLKTPSVRWENRQMKYGMSLLLWFNCCINLSVYQSWSHSLVHQARQQHCECVGWSHYWCDLLTSNTIARKTHRRQLCRGRAIIHCVEERTKTSQKPSVALFAWALKTPYHKSIGERLTKCPRLPSSFSGSGNPPH